MEEACYGLLGYRPTDAGLDYLSFRQFCVAMRGHELRERKEWERALHLSNAWTGQSLSYDDLFGAGAAFGWQRQADTTKDDYEALKRRFKA